MKSTLIRVHVDPSSGFSDLHGLTGQSKHSRTGARSWNPESPTLPTLAAAGVQMYSKTSLYCRGKRQHTELLRQALPPLGAS